jgi:hypothetical protein
MSKEFGIDWKKYDSKRMLEFLLIMQIENNLKNNGRSKGKTNIRNSSTRSG